MPLKKKKFIKKKKKSIASSSFPKKTHLRCDGATAAGSGSALKRHPSLLCNKSSYKTCDKGGVKRIFTPFNRFANNNIRIADKTQNNMALQSSNRATAATGLSCKEKAYIICSCQTRLSRYVTLKNLASAAIKENKIFAVYGSCGAVRRALLERGWVEKIPPNKMNLSKIRNGVFTNKAEIHDELERLLLSNLVEKYNPNFIWRVKEDQRESPLIDMTKECNTIINKLKTDAMWTTKQGLCSSMKRNYWFYIEDVAEVNSPRTYNSYDVGEIEGFVRDYKITACTSLLKWILSMVANDRPIFLSLGKISINVLVFALNRCKEYLFRKQHKDIDRTLNSASSGQWNAFLKKYYRIIAKQDVFQEDKENKLPLYLGYAKVLLKEIHRYRPQLSCEGCHNIWIIKPAHNCRGRGIRMASKLGVITNLLNKANAKYVIQKYIEEPLLIHDTKFDIRQYYLVTSTHPLVIWMYTKCYLKFSSQKYSLKNYHESIHLTNNAVQKKYRNCLGRHPELPNNNMWDLEMYKDYLNKIGKENAWDNIIYPGMKKTITGIMLSCQDSLTVSKNRFELYGCDFILDKNYKPWLIEINSCPDLNPTTQVTAKICPAVVSDIIKVVIDHARNNNACTGNFECIYRQPVPIPRYGGASDLFVRGFALPTDYFYRGNIEITESYDDPNIGKERDIKAILNKLKQFYDTDIMVQPDDEGSSDSENNIEMEENSDPVACAHNTESENELSIAATVITEQLDEIVHRITSEYGFSSKFFDIQDSTSHSLDDHCHLIERMRSVTDIKALLQNPCCRLPSAKDVNGKQDFSFSELDDGPQGKGSFVEFNPIEKMIQNLTSDVAITQDINKPQNKVMKATSKIISFINQKEKEYFKQSRK